MEVLGEEGKWGVIAKMDDLYQVDLGCGPNKSQRFQGAECLRLDVDKKYHPDIVADIQRLPFRDKVFTEGLCDNVLEHCENPERAAREIGRTCRKAEVVLPKWYRHTAWYMGVGGVGGRHKCLYFRGRFVRIPFFLAGMHLYWLAVSSQHTFGRALQKRLGFSPRRFFSYVQINQISVKGGEY